MDSIEPADSGQQPIISQFTPQGESGVPAVRPSENQPGSIREQLAALTTHWLDPDPDRESAWERARASNIPHAGGSL